MFNKITRNTNQEQNRHHNKYKKQQESHQQQNQNHQEQNQKQLTLAWCKSNTGWQSQWCFPVELEPGENIAMVTASFTHCSRCGCLVHFASSLLSSFEVCWSFREDSVDATSDLWLAPQSIADNKGSSRSCRQDPVLGESPDNHDVVRVMMTMMMTKSKYWSPPRAQHYQRSACQKADLVRTTYECSTRSPPWLCTHSRWTDSANLKSSDNCNVLFFLSKTGSSCRQMNEDGTCPREFFILYLFWVSKPTPITPAMASNASIWFKMVTSSAARQWQVELEMAMLWTQTFCLMMSWSMRARYSRPGGQSTGTRFWETCRKSWCAGINKAA